MSMSYNIPNSVIIAMVCRCFLEKQSLLLILKFIRHIIFSPRYGEVVDINLVRDKGTGKSKGFAFLAYEDQRSTVLAVGWF